MEPAILKFSDVLCTNADDETLHNILVNYKEHKSCNEKSHVAVVATKCTCRTPWCESCSLYYWAPKIIGRLETFDWKSTRHIVLTIDRKKFTSPKEAFEFIQTKKMIPQLIHNLKRTKQCDVVDWLWLLEWHNDGYAHWHLLIEINNKSSESDQINFENIIEYWNIGEVILLDIKTKKHFKNLIQYLVKNKKQARLPQWAQDERKMIRRSGAKQQKKHKAETKEKSKNTKSTATEKKQRKTYREILEKCGKATNFCISLGNSVISWQQLQIPYKQFRNKYLGEFVENKGYVVKMSFSSFIHFFQENSSLLKKIPNKLYQFVQKIKFKIYGDNMQ